MKILELGKFYPPHHGGMETLLQSLSEGFTRRGAEVDCVVANDFARTERQTGAGLRVHRLASFGTLFSVSLCPAYLDSTRRIGADVWHAHFPNPLADLACLRGDSRVPLVISYHSDVIRQRRLMRFYEPLFRRMLARATRIVVATPRHIDYSPWLPAWRDKCDVIPYGIRLDRFRATEAIDRRAAELKAEAGGLPVLLNVGRLVGYKGQRFLLEAARTVEAMVWIVGNGPLEHDLGSLARALGIAHRVKFWGDAPDELLPSLFHACDVFVLPSITPNEGFGLVQVEAMACGKPVISCDLPSGVPFVNQHEVTGLIVAPENVRALEASIRALLVAPDRRRELGAAGRLRALREFDEQVMLDRYWRCFQSLVGGQTRG